MTCSSAFPVLSICENTRQMERSMFWIVPLLVLSDFASSIRVFQSQIKLGDEREDAISGAKLIDDRKVKVTDITLCIRFNFQLLEYHEGRSRLITIEDFRTNATDPEFAMMFFGADYPKSFFGFGHPRARGSYKSFFLQDAESGDWEVWATNRWTHVCIAYEKRRGFIKVIKDGKPLSINHADPEMTQVDIPDDFLSKIYVGRCSFDFNNGCASPEGKIADFNVWDEFLSTEMLEEWTQCKNLAKGNLVSWETARFEMLNLDVIEMDMDTVCHPVRPGHVILPTPRSFLDHRDVCNKFHGAVSVIRDEETQDDLMEEVKKHPSCTTTGKSAGADVRFWGGWWDSPSEGTYVDAADGSTLLSTSPFAPWYFGEPNGNTAENCVVVWVNRRAWNDQDCEAKMCGFCELEEAPDVRIRGLCALSAFDRKYSWTRDLIDGMYTFRGFQRTQLRLDSPASQWRLVLDGDNSSYAAVNGTEYPFGTKVWDVHGDLDCMDVKNAEDMVQQLALNINTCTDEEFNCGDGYCVDISLRCDGDIDCPDKTDEVDCSLYEIDDSYIRSSPPKGVAGGDSLAEVGVGVELLSILEISEVDGLIALQIRLNLTWLDGRLTMLNLKAKESLNSLDYDARKRIWVPQLIFHNTEHKMESVIDNKAFATVARNGEFIRRNLTHLHNAYLYSGKENPITLSRVYSEKFLCDFDMSVYPFDTQSCKITFVMKGNDDNLVKLLSKRLQYLGPRDLTTYFVKDYIITDETLSSAAGGIQSVNVKLTFGRRILSTILTTYLPTFLICIMAFATNYFKGFFFEAIVTVNLTSLLVLTTLFISVSNSLPTTAYVKFMDVWLIFCLLVPFSEVILQTFIEHNTSANEVNHHGLARKISVAPKNSNNKNRHMDAFADKTAMSRQRRVFVARLLASKGMPTVFTLFTTAYFITGAVYYKS